jgi:PPE-repeat protein
MDLDDDLGPDGAAPLGDERVASTVASDQGAGALGFAGTAGKGGVRAAGLTTLAGNEFGGGPSVPMVPGTWDQDSDGSSESGRGGSNN